MIDGVWDELIIILLLICLSAFFAGSETALTAVSRARVFYLINTGLRSAILVGRLREKKDRLIASLLLGNTLVNIASASLGTAVAISFFGVERGPIYATIVMTFLVLVFAEVLPKTIAINTAERFALAVARPVTFFLAIFSPLTSMVQWIIRMILRLAGVDYSNAHSLISAADVIRGTIELHHSEGEVEKQDRDMLGSILDLSDREIGEVMVHRKHVYAIDIGLEPDDIIQQAIDTVHSRIPLYKDNSDNIIGILHVKDVLKLVTSQKIGITREMIRRIAAKPWFVPETTPMDSQLYAFRHRRKHFACVVDEYGAFLGIVTLEDIIEEIVGEIDDEHDALVADEIMPYGKSAYQVEGTMTIRDLNRHLDWKLPDEHATTIAGLIMHEAEQIPEQASVFEFYGVRFSVAERKGNQLTRIIMERITPTDADSHEGH